jgi:hypothetical protein
MNKEEFEKWKRITEVSENNWLFDPIVSANTPGSHLIYKGGFNGGYVWIEPNGEACIGTYQGAIPHIGEAMFTPLYSNRVADTGDEALAIVCDKLGLDISAQIIREQIAKATV